jgi:tripartite ATP-independent transporter DctM subunit
MVFCLVASVDYTLAFKAVLVPGILVIILLMIFALIEGIREKIPLDKFNVREMGAALWDLKWELLIPVVLVKGLMSGLASIDEVAGLVAVYVFVAEFFLYKDLSIKKDLGRIAKSSMTMAGAIIMILGMANALMHYVELEEIPKRILEVLLKLGIEHRWQFLIVMNVFLLILGMLMEGFSAILVAVPLMLPFVADLGTRHPEEAMSPFHLAMIFILNLELAFCLPPLGLNLFISSFRFNKPVTQMYRAVLPFLAVLAVALGVVSYVPWFSTVAVQKDITELRAKAVELGEAPKAAWMLECVQLDPTDPKPCSAEDRKKWASAQAADVPKDPGEAKSGSESDLPAEASGECDPDFGPCDAGPGKPSPSGKPAAPSKKEKEACDPDFGPCDGG